MADVAEVQRRLILAARYAEIDEDYRRLLQRDPTAALAHFKIRPFDVREVESIFEDDDEPPGCADGTCWVSLCPETCYVTVCSPSGFLGDPEERVSGPIEQVLKEHGLERRVDREEPG
jgi:hypothetical protein